MVWGLVSASLVFWILRLGVKAPSVPPYTVVKLADPLAGEDFSRMLGAEASPGQAGSPSVPPAEAARFQLLGLVAGVTPDSPSALALIAVDGKPAKPYAVGARLGEGWVVQSVSQRSVALGPEGSQTPGAVLEIPTLPPASTGRIEAAVPSP